MKGKHFELIFFGIILTSILISCVFALTQHYVTITSGDASYIVSEDYSFSFNFSVNNSMADNLSRVNITIPTSFTFAYWSNGTSASDVPRSVNGIFTNTSDYILDWYNTTTLIIPDTNATFWFNATPSTPGTYTFTINTANSTGVLINTSTITIIVMEIHNVMNTFGHRNFTPINEDTTTVFNFTVNSTVRRTLGNVTNVTISFPSSFNYTLNSNYTTAYAGLGILVSNTSTSVTWKNTTNGLEGNNTLVNMSFGLSLSAQEPGTFNFTVTSVNSADDGIHQQNFTVTVRDITNPTAPTYNCSKSSGIAVGELVSCVCTTLDNYDASLTYSYSSILPTDLDGSFNVGCIATDDAGYNSSSTFDYTVDPGTDGSYSPGNSGSSNTYTNTYVEDTKEFSEVKVISKQLKNNEKIRIMVSGAKHNIGVTSLTASTAAIEVFSTLQKATLSIGDERKFDLTDDGYYDLSVTLNKIEASKADLSLNSIKELITQETEEVEQTSEVAAQETATQEELPAVEGDLTWLWISIGVVIVLIVAGILYKKYKK